MLDAGGRPLLGASIRPPSIARLHAPPLPDDDDDGGGGAASHVLLVLDEPGALVLLPLDSSEQPSLVARALPRAEPRAAAPGARASRALCTDAHGDCVVVGGSGGCRELLLLDTRRRVVLASVCLPSAPRCAAIGAAARLRSRAANGLSLIHI